MVMKRDSIHRAVVVDVNDPKKLDRIRVRVPEVLGNTITDWVLPKHPVPYWSWKPVVNDNVWVEFESGDVDRPLYSGTWYSQRDGESTIPQESQDEYPFHRMMATPAGHKIEFKDISLDENDEPVEDSPQYMRITTAGGSVGQHKIELTDTKDAEQLLIQSASGNKIQMDDVSGSEKIGIETPGGHKFEMDDGGTTILIAHSDNTTKIEIDSAGNVKITAAALIELIGNNAAPPTFGVVCAGTPLTPCAFTGGPHPQGSNGVKASVT